ncbi:MAG: strawberry notch family protein [Muribaculaceae bacterium]|nr:strawberry notch family protein [Muribaculaceae bacterium]
MSETVEYKSLSAEDIPSLGSMIPTQLERETQHAYKQMNSALGGKVVDFVASRLHFSPDELVVALAAEQVDGVALAIYNIEARSQSVIIGDQTGIGKGRQAAAMIRYGMLAGYLPIFLTDRYTLFSDMYRDCKALGIHEARPLILNKKVSIVDFDKPVDEEPAPSVDEIWSPSEDVEDEEDIAGLYTKHYEEVYKSPKKAELELMYRAGDIPKGRFEYVMLTYSQLKDARKDRTRLEFLTSLCEKHRVLFVFDEAHKSSSVTDGKASIITQCINSILEACPATQCVFLSATFAKRPECLITFMRQTLLSSLATNDTLQAAFAGGGVPMQEYVASMLAREGQMVRREHSGEGIPEPVYTYLDDRFTIHSELFDKVMHRFRELVNLSEMIKSAFTIAKLLDIKPPKSYPTRAQLFYVNKILLLSLKAGDVAEAAVREVQAGRSVVIGMSDTLECVLRDNIDLADGRNPVGDFSTILLRLLDKTLAPALELIDMLFSGDYDDIPDLENLLVKLDEVKAYGEQIRGDILETVFHLPLSPIDVIRQLITRETFVDREGNERPIRFEECTGRARRLEYLSPEGDDDFVNATVVPRKKRHSNHIYNDFQNNKLDVILINACGAIGASAHAVATAEVDESAVRQRKMLIVQNDLDVNIDLQKRGRINRTGQIASLPPLYEYIITAIPSEKRLNMMLRAKLRSLSANTTANQDQDRRQADFIDITNKYGNTVTQEYLTANPDLALTLGLGKTATASQLLARVAMLSVSAQQDIIDDIFGAYQNLEQELRRINQWDLEREYRDFEAQFVKEELFTAAVDKTVLGGASMLTTFRCRHRTYPYDSKTLKKQVENGQKEYGKELFRSQKLKKEIDEYYSAERQKIIDHFMERQEKLNEATVAALVKLGMSVDKATMAVAVCNNNLLFLTTIFKKIRSIVKGLPNFDRITSKLNVLLVDKKELERRKEKEIDAKWKQRSHLEYVISKAVIGRGYYNILSLLPAEEKVNRVIAVLKEVRFGKNPKQRFLPSKVQFVFALSALHKELVLNLVDKGAQNSYDRLCDILRSATWTFSARTWDEEIARYNNRILERKIITGNILGAFANPIISKIKPRFITFSLAPDDNGEVAVERGLLLPMNGENLDSLQANVSIPLAEGVKYATGINQVYRISGIGLDFSIVPHASKNFKNLVFRVVVDEKDCRRFEDDTRFDTIRQYFEVAPVRSLYNTKKAPSKRQLKHYSADNLTADSAAYIEIMSLLASLRAMIMIPREYLSVGDMKGYTRVGLSNANSNWPRLDRDGDAVLPPARREIEIRVTPPVVPDALVQFVDEYPPTVGMCNLTLKLEGRSFSEKGVPDQLRDIYFQWNKFLTRAIRENNNPNRALGFIVTDDLYHILECQMKEPVIKFGERALELLKKEATKYQLSEVGKTLIRFREEMLFLAPPIEIAQEFLDNCLCSPRLAKVRRALENYIAGKTDVITAG